MRGRHRKAGARKARYAHVAAEPRESGGSARGAVVELLEERVSHHETSPLLSGGDIDADWQSALSTGEEAVGGSAMTPNQDVVDEIGRALGVEQELNEEVHTSAEILGDRERDYWQREWRVAHDADEHDT